MQTTTIEQHGTDIVPANEDFIAESFRLTMENVAKAKPLMDERTTLVLRMRKDQELFDRLNSQIKVLLPELRLPLDVTHPQTGFELFPTGAATKAAPKKGGKGNGKGAAGKPGAGAGTKAGKKGADQRMPYGFYGTQGEPILRSEEIPRFEADKLALPMDEDNNQQPLHMWITRSLKIRGPLGLGEIVAAVGQDGYQSDSGNMTDSVMQTIRKGISSGRFGYANQKLNKSNKYDYIPKLPAQTV
jgi:hypothetical protein